MMDARTYAVLSLDGRGLPGLPRQAFKRRSPVRPADPRDAALGETIILGVIRTLAFLEHHLAAHAKRPIEKVDARAKIILLVALYQLHFLDRVPDSAVVNEAVRQARVLHSPNAMGFVNAVLRQAQREPEVPLPTKDEPAEYARVVLSHPPACYERFADLMGVEQALATCAMHNREPPTLVRLNEGHDLEALRQALPGVEVEPHEEAGIVVVRGAKQSDYAAIAEAGIGQVQDATSARTVSHVDWTGRVLDRCCGVGTKTLQIAALAPAAKIIAVDSHGKRIRTLRESLASRGIENVDAVRVEWLAESPLAGQAFDRILIDAPCSNSGVIARRPEARFRQDADHVIEVVALQRRILDDTLPALALGGRLVYATCSVWPEENRQQVDRVLGAHPDLTLIEDRLTLPTTEDDPTRHHDGGYVAVIGRV